MTARPQPPVTVAGPIADYLLWMRVRGCAGTSIATALGIPDTFHATRHRFGTLVYRASRDIRTTQQALGHVSPANTARYTAVDVDDMRAAVLAVAGGGPR